jgi:hypothetical protein
LPYGCSQFSTKLSGGGVEPGTGTFITKRAAVGQRRDVIAHVPAAELQLHELPRRPIDRRRLERSSVTAISQRSGPW